MSICQAHYVKCFIKSLTVQITDSAFKTMDLESTFVSQGPHHDRKMTQKEIPEHVFRYSLSPDKKAPWGVGEDEGLANFYSFHHRIPRNLVHDILGMS